MAASVEDIESRFRANLSRVRSLIEIYDRLTGGARGRASVAETDLLRSAVVLLHATLEDLLRGLLAQRLPSAPPDSLNGLPLPLPPTSKPKDPKPKPLISIVDLAAFRGRTVDGVIRDAVAAWLEWSNYNVVKDIADGLERIGLPTTLIGPLGGDLDAMMKRRHLIAHRADASESTGPGHHSARSLRRNTVTSWISAVEQFGEGAIGAIRTATLPGSL